ncbi:MBL fold metallo-hydrolase [Ktedonobacter sp. SOSP1-52]|uniref:MBL fold metallo-hydrolase n=1 Tax=Ktedonobacter sp. SOSP1-52 TaxID=2778366 RepID=UPI001915350D|nr:MBL fold metallo-hydrolase [Ktedonobacter sp. SOSP1-52]GHO70309.1 MBL fold metallo-hydrolase [Ktedonobacter sp. SOSP1-52]
MQIHFLRHATLVLTIHNLKILVDPMLSPQGAIDPIPNAGNQIRNPMMPLPLSDEELQQVINNLDAVLITHTHRDHWDPAAQDLLPKDLPLLCQPADQAKLEQAGFTQVLPISERLTWRGLEIDRTGGQHGTGELGKMMGPVSGFVLKAEGEPALYIAGDTIWCSDVEQALTQHKPDVVMLNAGAPTFVTGGGPITMDENDVCQVCRSIPEANIVAVHMETINHCRLTRAALRDKLEAEELEKQVSIPQDGEILTF